MEGERIPETMCRIQRVDQNAAITPTRPKRAETRFSARGETAGSLNREAYAVGTLSLLIGEATIQLCWI